MRSEIKEGRGFHSFDLMLEKKFGGSPFDGVLSRTMDQVEGIGALRQGSLDRLDCFFNSGRYQSCCSETAE